MSEEKSNFYYNLGAIMFGLHIWKMLRNSILEYYFLRLSEFLKYENSLLEEIPRSFNTKIELYNFLDDDIKMDVLSKIVGNHTDELKPNEIPKLIARNKMLINSLENYKEKYTYYRIFIKFGLLYFLSICLDISCVYNANLNIIFFIFVLVFPPYSVIHEFLIILYDIAMFLFFVLTRFIIYLNVRYYLKKISNC